MQMAPSYGPYGYNPNYTLAESPYSRLTGQYTPINEQMVPGAASYLQPVFVDIDPMIGNTGIPSYPSLISEFAMKNPQLPLAMSGQFYSPQQMYGRQPQYGMQQPQYGMQQPQYRMQQPQYVMQQQQYGMQQTQYAPTPIPNPFVKIVNLMRQHAMQQCAPVQQPQQCGGIVQQMSSFGQWLGGVFGNFAQSLGNIFNTHGHHGHHGCH